jgi:hypothetical protein
MREASRDKATPLEEGGRKDNLDRCQPPFGKVRGVANRSDCLDGIDWALAHSLNDDHSQTAWLGDAICTRHRDAKWPLFLTVGLWDVHPFDRHWFKGFGFEVFLEPCAVSLEVSIAGAHGFTISTCRFSSLVGIDGVVSYSQPDFGPRSRRRPLSATQHNPTTPLVDISFHCHET